MYKKKILFLFYRSPLDFKTSNDQRQNLIYSTLKDNFEVKILTFGNKNLQSEEQDVVLLRKSNTEKLFKFLFRLQSPRLTHYLSQEFKKLFEELLINFKPDYIYVEHLLMMQYVMNTKTNSKIIFFNDESNLYIKEKNLRGSFYQKLRNSGLAKLETEACKKADVVLTITEDEENFLRQKGYKNVLTIPYGINKDYFEFNWKNPEEKTIIFLGDYSHYPNRKAIKYLINHIIPNLSDIGVSLKIVGRNTDCIKNLLSGSVKVFENVPEVRSYLYNSSVFVAPIFTGAGLRVKILEAALCGVPLVISPAANLGINFVDKEEAFICNSKLEFNEVLRNLFSSKYDDTIDSMRLNARNKIISKFDERIVKEKIISMFN